MNRLLLEMSNKHQSYRNMINLYWITIILTVLLEYLIHRLGPQSGSVSFLFLLAMQALGLAAVTGVTEMLHRYRKLHSDTLLLITGIIYASSIIYINPTIGIVPAIYIFPILTSILSFNKNRILLSFVLILLCLGVMYALTPNLRLIMEPVHIIGILFLYIGVTIIALSITISGTELLNNLSYAIEAKQELLVKNVIMEKLSKTDALTELYNHKTFHEYLEKLIEQSELNQLTLQLAIMDIDNFKKINDTYGHWIGDVILQQVAVILRETVTPNDFVARYGGEEFAVIFTEKTLEQAYAITEQIRVKLAKTLHPELDSQAVTISVGLQDYIKGAGKETLFKGADASLYTAKRTGKNKTVTHLRVSDPKGA
jgi:diguanylate cyclase (GGDEF)-like protein